MPRTESLSQLSSLWPRHYHYVAWVATELYHLQNMFYRGAISHILFKFSVFYSFLQVISSCLRLIPRLSVPYVSFNNRRWRNFLCEMWPTHFTLFVQCGIDSYFTTLNQQNTQSISCMLPSTMGHYKDSTKCIPHKAKLIPLHNRRCQIVKM
jgi:hypothetical protein